MLRGVQAGVIVSQRGILVMRGRMFATGCFCRLHRVMRAVATDVTRRTDRRLKRHGEEQQEQDEATQRLHAARV